jgi:hypothetical protein
VVRIVFVLWTATLVALVGVLLQLRRVLRTTSQVTT